MKHIKVVVEKDKEVIDDGSVCVCGKCEIKEHTCPFSEEIHDDFELLCTCCVYCSQQCAWDI
jgi:hypothetical protein